MSEKRTLRESHEAIESIAKEVKTLLGVAALDVRDAYGDSTLVDVFMVPNAEGGGGSHRDLPIARRFADMLVHRILYTPEIILDWAGEQNSEGNET